MKADVRFVLVGGLAVSPRDIDDLQALEAAHAPEPDEPEQSADADSE